MSNTTGALASATWLRSIAAQPPSERWHVEILLGVTHKRPNSDDDASTETRFHIQIYSEEWSVFVSHHGQASWVRVTDVPFEHVRDDFKLLASFPPLNDVGTLLHKLEKQLGVQFAREHATIHTNLLESEPDIRRWIEAL